MKKFITINRLKKLVIAIAVIISQVIINPVITDIRAQSAETETGLYFTYIGPIVGGGINQITYSDWIDNKRDTQEVSGNYYSSGLILDIFVNNIVGEFTLQYIYNSSGGEPDISVQHLLYTASGKYSFNFGAIALAHGLGLYMETPPSDKKYDGGSGFSASLGIFYTINMDIKLLFDITGRYGSFGMGEDSSKISYGAKFGLVYSIGRI